MLHVLQLGRDDDAVMMAAVARQDADQRVGRGVDDGDAALLALEELGVFEPKEVDEAFEQIAETGGEE